MIILNPVNDDNLNWNWNSTSNSIWFFQELKKRLLSKLNKSPSETPLYSLNIFSWWEIKGFIESLDMPSIKSSVISSLNLCYSGKYIFSLKVHSICGRFYIIFYCKDCIFLFMSPLLLSENRVYTHAEYNALLLLSS